MCVRGEATAVVLAVLEAMASGHSMEESLSCNGYNEYKLDGKPVNT